MTTDAPKITAESFAALTRDLDMLTENLRGEQRDTEAIIVIDAVEILRLWRLALVELSTTVIVRPSATGEAATRAVQGRAARALRGEK